MFLSLLVLCALVVLSLASLSMCLSVFLTVLVLLALVVFMLPVTVVQRDGWGNWCDFRLGLLSLDSLLSIHLTLFLSRPVLPALVG